MEEVQRIFIDIPQISLEEQEKYQGLEVAILDGKIVAVGHTSLEVLQKALEQFPDRREEIAICYIMPEPDILVLWRSLLSSTSAADFPSTHGVGDGGDAINGGSSDGTAQPQVV